MRRAIACWDSQGHPYHWIPRWTPVSLPVPDYLDGVFDEPGAARTVRGSKTTAPIQVNAHCLDEALSGNCRFIAFVLATGVALPASGRPVPDSPSRQLMRCGP